MMKKPFAPLCEKKTLAPLCEKKKTQNFVLRGEKQEI
jgi:hypothetical protein